MRAHVSINRLAFLLPLTLLLSLYRPLSGSPPRLYEPFVATPEYRQAEVLWANGNYEGARNALTAIASSNPGTTLGATALLRRSELDWVANQIELAKAGYLEVSAAYPSSSFEIASRAALIAINFRANTGTAAELAQLDDLLKQYGGPSIKAVTSSPNQAVRQFMSLHPETRLGLEGVYGQIISILEVQGRYQDGLAMAEFVQDEFPASPSYSQYAQDVLTFQMLQRFGTTDFTPGPAVDPRIRIYSPKPNSRKGPRPKIRFQISAGDWKSPQIDLGKLRFTLDGQSVVGLMRLRAIRGNRLKDGAVYEKLRISARPDLRLQPGVHVVEVTASVKYFSGQGPGQSNATWQFIVANAKDDWEDECDDEQNSWDGDD